MNVTVRRRAENRVLDWDYTAGARLRFMEGVFL